MCKEKKTSAAGRQKINNGGTMSVLKVKVMRLDRNGIMRTYTMKLRDTKNSNLEIEKLANMAESCYIDSKSK